MSSQITPIVKRTGKPVAAGILNIIAGAGCVVGALGWGVAGGICGALGGFPFFIPGFLFGLLAIPAILLGILSIIGGVYALQRRRWGCALAGSIGAILSSHILGLISIILIALSRNEFES
jgi:hypothetical protein